MTVRSAQAAQARLERARNSPIRPGRSESVVRVFQKSRREPAEDAYRHQSRESHDILPRSLYDDSRKSAPSGWPWPTKPKGT